MAEVTNELIYEISKGMQADMSSARMDIAELKSELRSIRGHMLSTRQDIHTIYGVPARQDDRLDRIEHRLELRELAEPATSYDPAR